MSTTTLVPPVAASRRVAPPEMLDTVLPNGLRVIVARAATMPTIEVRVSIPLGACGFSTGCSQETRHSAAYGDWHAAAAELLSATLFAGTRGKTRADIDAELAEIGGSIRATADPQWLTISARVLASGTSDALGVLADALIDANHCQEVFTAERDRIADRVRISRSLPKPTARMALLGHVFGNHPIVEQVPDEQRSRTVPRDALVALHESHIVPTGSVLTVVGDVAPPLVVTEAAAIFERWRSSHSAHRLQVPPPHLDRAGQLVVQTGATHADVRLAGPSIARTHHDYAAVRLADRVVGGYFLSRLVRTLREDKGYIYAGSSAVQHFEDAAMSVVEFSTAPATLQPALAATYDELAALTQTRMPDDEEIERARRHLLGTTALAMSTQAGLASALNNSARAGLGYDWLRQHLDDVEACRPDAVRQAVQNYYRPEGFTGIVIAADGTDIVGLRR